jgi:hypothetical protein
MSVAVLQRPRVQRHETGRDVLDHIARRIGAQLDAARDILDRNGARHCSELSVRDLCRYYSHLVAATEPVAVRKLLLTVGDDSSY